MLLLEKLENGCQVLLSVFRCFCVECPVETRTGVEFSEHHTTTNTLQEPLVVVVLADCPWVAFSIETCAIAGCWKSLC